MKVYIIKQKQKCSNQNLGLIVCASVVDLVSNIVSFGIERGVLRKATAKVFSHFNTGKLSNQCQEPNKWEFFFLCSALGGGS